MELRRQGIWAISVLLIWGNVLSSVLAGFNDSSAIVQSLDCTNDFIDWISCDMKAPNCTQYQLLLVQENKENKTMQCKKCAEGQCCCYLNPENKILLIYGENHTVSVWKGGENLGSKHISIIDGIKPRVPTIYHIRNSNGNFEIMWKSNMEGYSSSQLNARVTYFKKGETNKTSIHVTPTSRDNLNVYQIPGRNLEPSTTYVVCVQSYSKWSRRYSDCSPEMTFSTPMSRGTLTLAIIISLSLAAVLISSGVFVCFVKIKTLWWDTVPKPKLLLMTLSEQKILKPVLPVVSLVRVEPLMTPHSKPWWAECGIPAGGHPSAFTSLSPASTRLPQRLSDSGLSSSPSHFAGSSGFDNKTYSIILPAFPQQEERQEVGTQDQVICDPAYGAAHDDGDGQQLLEQLLLTSALLPLMDTDMCYQVSKGSVQVPLVGEPRRSSSSSTSSTLCDSSSGPWLEFHTADRDAAKVDNSGEMGVFWDENLPAGSNSSLPVDFSYQTFQSLVEPSAALSLESCCSEEQQNGRPDAPLLATSHHLSLPVVSCGTDGVHSGSTSPTFQKPFFSLLSASQSTPTLIVDSGYRRAVNTEAW